MDPGFGNRQPLFCAAPNSIPAAFVFTGCDLERAASVLQEESPANARASTRRVRQYSDWHGFGGMCLLPTTRINAESQPDGHGLLHIELPEESMCLGIRLVSAGQILLLHRDKVFESSWSTLAHMIDGFVGFKETMFFRIMKEDPQLEQSDSGLLDLLAAASSSRKRPAAVLQPEAAPRNEGEVDVDRELLQLLQQEVDEALRDVDCRTNTAFASTVCPCCPWRRFDKRANLRRHLRSQHTEAKRYCPSGTKQLRIASALYDHDAIAGKTMQTGFFGKIFGHYQIRRQTSSSHQECGSTRP